MSPPYSFETIATEVANDLSNNIRGKIILTTGVTPNSLGSQFVKTLASHSPALLILTSRTQETIDATTTAIHQKNPDVPIRSILVDLSSLAPVDEAASQIVQMQKKDGIVTDVLMLNAGLMACPYGTTADGFERQFGICHLGHFVFGNMIIPGMLGPNFKPRVVVVSSEGHQLGPVRFPEVGFMGGQEYDRLRAYGQAKTANNLLAEKLGLKGLQAYSLHPGGIFTNLGRHMDVARDIQEMREFSPINCTPYICQTAINAYFGEMICRGVGSPLGFQEHIQKLKFKNHDQGTATHIVAAFADYLEKDNGKYLVDGKIASWDMVSPWARNSYDAERLWKLSEELAGEKFDL